MTRERGRLVVTFQSWEAPTMVTEEPAGFGEETFTEFTVETTWSSARAVKSRLEEVAVGAEEDGRIDAVAMGITAYSRLAALYWERWGSMPDGHYPWSIYASASMPEMAIEPLYRNERKMTEEFVPEDQR